MKIFWRIFSLSLCAVLAGCATFSSGPSEPLHQPAWGNHVPVVPGFARWSTSGLIAIRTPQNAWSANLQWAQNKSNYTIWIFGPLGANSITLTGANNNVVLALADGRAFRANNPENLVAAELGWNLPVSNLFYWIHGLAVPHTPAQKTFDANHHLVQLFQDGWQIQFLNYTTTPKGDLPMRIFMTSKALTVKIVVNQYQF